MLPGASAIYYAEVFTPCCFKGFSTPFRYLAAERLISYRWEDTLGHRFERGT